VAKRDAIPKDPGKEPIVQDILGSSGLSLHELLAIKDTTKQNVGKILFLPDGVFLSEPFPKHWLGRRGLIIVVFDQEGHVGWKGFQRWRSDFWDGLRDWLGW